MPQQKSWIDAVVRWLEESAHKRSLVTDKFHLAFLDPYLGQKTLDEINSELIEFIAQEKEQTNVTPTTVNRMLEVIRAILNKAHKEWQWINTMPLFRMRKVENKRIRWLSSVQAGKLLQELPNHLKDMAAFTLATGLRQSNVTKLQWSEVDLIRKHALIHPDQSKTKKAIPVPLNSQAIAIIEKQKAYTPHLYLPILVSLLRDVIIMLGKKRWFGQESKIFVGMTCVTLGQVGMCKMVPHCKNYSN